MSARMLTNTQLRQAMRAGPDEPHLRLLLVVLLLHVDRGGVCWPTQETLAAMTGTHERQIRSNLRALEEQGWVVVGRTGRRNRYLVDLNRIGIPEADCRYQRPDTGSPASSIPAVQRTTPAVQRRDTGSALPPEVLRSTQKKEPPPKTRARETRTRGGGGPANHNYPPHPHEPNVRRSIQAGQLSGLPRHPEQHWVDLAYQAGHGDPWTGYLALRQINQDGLEPDIRDPDRVIAHRLGIRSQP